MPHYFETRDLAVGYNGSILIHDINIQIEKGKILTLIGPNGAGKSTILKTITKHLSAIHGTVEIGKHEISGWTPKEMAKQVAVVLTDRIRPELMTCAEVVAMGRYPYTNHFGMLTDSRSFSSYCRFDFFRRILCDYVGNLVEKGEYDSNSALQLVENICYYNAKRMVES